MLQGDEKMGLLDNPMLLQLQRYMDVAAYRQTLIASNMANVDTPGYRTVDIDFQSALRAAENQMVSESKVQNVVANQVRPVPGLLQRPDGNNVSIDREGTLMAQTQLEFSTAAAILKEEFHRVQMAIEGQ